MQQIKKKFLFTVVAVGVLVFTLLPSDRRKHYNGPVRVCGRGRVKLPADGVVLRFEATGSSNVLKNAQKECEHCADALCQAVGAYGAVSQDGCYTTENPAGARYTVTRVLLLRCDLPVDVVSLCSLLSEKGAAAVYAPTYTRKDPTPFQYEALQNAIDDAKAKAAMLDLDLRVCGVHEKEPFYTENAADGTPFLFAESRAEVLFGKPRR